MISFINHKTSFLLDFEPELLSWLNDLAHLEGYVIKKLQYNYVSLSQIQEINNRHLGHDYPTDVITFDYSSGKQRNYTQKMSKLKVNISDLTKVTKKVESGIATEFCFGHLRTPSYGFPVRHHQHYSRVFALRSQYICPWFFRNVLRFSDE